MSEGFTIAIRTKNSTEMLAAMKTVKYVLDKIDEELLTNGWVTVRRVQYIFGWLGDVEFQYNKDYAGIDNFKDIYGWPVGLYKYILEPDFNSRILHVKLIDPSNLRRSKKVEVLKPEEDDMIKFYCDICGKNLSPSDRRYISISSIVNDVRDLALRKGDNYRTYMVCDTCGSKFTDILKGGKYTNEKDN